MNRFKQKCINLRKKDSTLTEITKITGRPKTSVWFHIKDIPLSKQKQEEISRQSAKHLVHYTSLRKGKSKRKFLPFNTWDIWNVSLLAHLLFDGQIIHSGCIYHNRSPVLIERVESCMRRMYAFEPKKSTDTRTGVIRISYFNVALSSYMKKKSKELLREIQNLPRNLQRVFVRAFFDDEGCMDFRARQVRGYQNDRGVLCLIQTLLQKFQIESRIVKGNVPEIVISRKENLIKFRDEINFSPGVRINGKRKNSVWKKDLEKRKILDMAIDSYKS